MVGAGSDEEEPRTYAYRDHDAAYQLSRTQASRA